MVGGFHGMLHQNAKHSSSESNEYQEHNIRNPMLELLCHAHSGVFMEAYFDEVDREESSFLVIFLGHTM